jgi:hypothetical protein
MCKVGNQLGFICRLQGIWSLRLAGRGWRQHVPPNINIHIQDSMVLNPEDYSLKNRLYENSEFTDFPFFSFTVIAADK